MQQDWQIKLKSLSDEELTDLIQSAHSDTCKNCWLDKYSIKLDENTYKCPTCGDIYCF